MPTTRKIKTVLSTTVGNANASSAGSPVTIQGMPHLSSLQALPITVEDGSAERAPRATLSPSPGSAQDPKLQDGILRPPGQGSISPLSGGGLCSIFTLK
ncbi:FXYD domain-containing ion transport regulator 3 isoform X1 [Phocoena sinus]|uniref:FXYD domain-containing ion transport regulator 3 isoform X1 n=1 Tax=Phocoena sinus TaxID=42100 RepID=UPI0013C4D34C|nr:FXYD domain-containing ion transport regulator 3 isoform X1 [Phocoena sinus]XP_032470578.1 FXYD domain-containing ion transport regulator 3 isoform X1 [Phocoena sinus]